MHPKKLAILINALEVAGAEKVVALLINHFYREFDIHLILLNNTIQFELPANIHIKIIDHSSLKSRNRALDILKIPLLSWRLTRYLEKEGIETCFSALNRSNFINCFQRILGWKGRILISERSHTSSVYPAGTIAGKTGRLLVRWLYRKATLNIPNSEGIAFDLRKNFGLDTDYHVIHNPINIRAQETEMQVPVDDVHFDCFTFCHAGRFEKSKNHLMLLQAIQLIKEHNFRVLIAGAGPTELWVRQKAEEMGLSGKIIFLGYRNNVVKYLSKSDGYLLTSDFEGFPNILLEALVCGTPIISTDCPTGPRELLTGKFDPNAICSDVEQAGYGLLVPVNNAAALSKAMLMMMENESLRNAYASKGKSRAQDYDISRIMEEYTEVFRN